MIARYFGLQYTSEMISDVRTSSLLSLRRVPKSVIQYVPYYANWWGKIGPEKLRF
jgi:hypothetical protein